MKSFLLFASLVISQLNPKKPFEGQAGAEFLTLDPHTAQGSPRPDCIRGKCHPNAWDTQGKKALLAVKFSKEVEDAYCADDGDLDNIYEFAKYSKDTDLIHRKTSHYDGVNIIIEQGDAGDLYALFLDLFKEDNAYLTIHYGNYKNFTKEGLDFSIANITNLFIKPPKDMKLPEYKTLSSIEQSYFWLAKDEDHASKFPPDYPEDKILISEDATFASDPLGTQDNYCS